jgi:hypothetical protein
VEANDARFKYPSSAKVLFPLFVLMSCKPEGTKDPVELFKVVHRAAKLLLGQDNGGDSSKTFDTRFTQLITFLDKTYVKAAANPTHLAIVSMFLACIVSEALDVLHKKGGSTSSSSSKMHQLLLSTFAVYAAPIRLALLTLYHRNNNGVTMVAKRVFAYYLLAQLGTLDKVERAVDAYEASSSIDAATLRKRSHLLVETAKFAKELMNALQTGLYSHALPYDAENNSERKKQPTMDIGAPTTPSASADSNRRTFSDRSS